MSETCEQPSEPGLAGVYAAAVLGTLWVTKAMGVIPWVGPMALSAAVFLQLWLPLSRCDAWQLPWSVLGLDKRHARSELVEASVTLAVLLPMYGLVTALFYTRGGAWLGHMLGPAWQGAIPAAHWGGVPWPQHSGDRLAFAWSGVEATLTHVLGVALPEETFFRGYLQAQWQKTWPVNAPGGGVQSGGPLANGLGLGRAAVAACALFALGHFVGEWHPGRLLPFFPGLLFARQRNRRGSLIGCIALHAACNLFSAGWGACFVPIGSSTP